MATNTYSLVISYRNAGQFSQNVLHYSFDDASYPDTQTAAAALCQQFDADNTTKLRNLLCLDVFILSYKARKLGGSGGFEAVRLLSPSLSGNRTGNVAASGVGPCIILYPTGNAKYRGRVFLPGISDSDCTNGGYTSGYKTAFSTNGSMFTATMVLPGGGTPTATPVIYSRKPLPSTSRTVEACRLSVMVATQRRRQRPA